MGINTGILQNAVPLSSTRIKELERERYWKTANLMRILMRIVSYALLFHPAQKVLNS